MTHLTWLHLSDWHQRDHDLDRRVVLDALVADIEERATISTALERVDLVVFSGDLAFAGRPDEYQRAADLFLDRVLDAVSLDRSNLFIVPGNHDLDRDHLYEMLPPELQAPLGNQLLVQKWGSPRVIVGEVKRLVRGGV